MSDNPQQAGWQSSIKPDFLQQVIHPLRQSVMRRPLADSIMGRIDRMLGRDALGTEINQRYQTYEGHQGGALPLATAQRIEQSPETPVRPSLTAQADSNRPIVTSRAVQRQPDQTISPSVPSAPEPIIRTRTIVRPITQRIIQRDEIASSVTPSSVEVTSASPDATQPQARQRTSQQSSETESSNETPTEPSPVRLSLQRMVDPSSPTPMTRFVYRTVEQSPVTSSGDTSTSSTNMPIQRQATQQTTPTASNEPQRPIVRPPLTRAQRLLNPMHMTTSAKRNVLSRQIEPTSPIRIQRQVFTQSANRPPLVRIQQSTGQTWLSRKIFPEAIRVTSPVLSERIMAQSAQTMPPSDSNIATNTRLTARASVQPEAQTTADNPPIVSAQTIQRASTQAIQYQDSSQGQRTQSNMPLSDSDTSQGTSDYAENIQRTTENAGDVPYPQGTVQRDTAQPNRPYIPLADSDNTIQRNADNTNDMPYPQGTIQRDTAQANRPNMPLADSGNIQRDADNTNDMPYPQGTIQRDTAQANRPNMPLADTGNTIQRDADNSGDVPYPQGTVQRETNQANRPNIPLADSGNSQRQADNSGDMPYPQGTVQRETNQANRPNMPLADSGNTIQHDADNTNDMSYQQGTGQPNRSNMSLADNGNIIQRDADNSGDVTYPQGTVQRHSTQSNRPNMPLADSGNTIQRDADNSGNVNYPQGTIQRETNQPSRPNMPLADSGNTVQRDADNSGNVTYQQGTVQRETGQPTRPNMPLADSGNIIQRDADNSGDVTYPQGTIQRETNQANRPNMPLADSGNTIQRDADNSSDMPYPQGTVQRETNQATRPNMPLADSGNTIQRDADNSSDMPYPQGTIQRDTAQAMNFPDMPLNQARGQSSASQREDSASPSNLMPLQGAVTRAQRITQQQAVSARPIARGTVQRTAGRNTSRLVTQPIYRNIATQGYETPPSSVSTTPDAQGIVQRTADNAVSSGTALPHAQPMAQSVNRLREQLTQTTQEIVQRQINNTSQTVIHQSTEPQIFRADDDAPTDSNNQTLEVDVDAIVEKVWRRIVRRLGIERERRGGRRWF